MDRIINIIYFSLILYDCASYITTAMSPVQSAIYLYFFFGPKHSPIAQSRLFTSLSDLYSSSSSVLESAQIASSKMAKVKTDIVIFSEPASWDQWYEDTKASMPSQMWKYFDPDSNSAFTEVVDTLMPLDEPPPDRNESP